MGTGGVISPARYQVLEVMDLPNAVQDELCNDCPSNDSARIVNPKYYPLLKRWLEDNEYDANTAYIAWWSW